MNLQQLRIVRETARRQFNLTAVSASLFTSQSGVSKHLRDLENELGVVLFERRGKRLMGLTEPGEVVLQSVERILSEIDTIKQSSQQFAHSDSGTLRIATTHTQARYALPKVLKAFQIKFPKVRLELHQCSPDEIVTMLKTGDVDVGIATEALLSNASTFACFPFYSWHHSVIVPKGHSLDIAVPLTLEALVQHPIITYHSGYTGRANIDEAFRKAGLKPEIAMSAVDADVIKTYVELGLGAGIIASVAFDPQRDTELRLLSGNSLFPSNTTLLAIRRNGFLRSYLYDFLQLCSPELKRAEVNHALISN
ncbi:CysB family HTH-type transcriptional regulator [Natronospirillum operosum]|uniref:CysB family HTH-type transcriptional regulator n=1 Tax=Natronospirillum operosum TaxID=2759953 RepID=A0A4Z0W1J4_9GAMM|nr:CysB family HTH-type transcriptional regulator [Natronospirillum operosum]TGG90310.1 CysB family HTH-type transcriptional regulator [Natronospirillum operosum]